MRKIRPFITVQQHIMEMQRRHPTATGDFSLLLAGIALATRFIANEVRRAGLKDVFGGTGDVNVQGELVQKLDQYADDTIIRCLDYRDVVSMIASEENQEAILLHNSPDGGKYIVIFDPLDGSSNIDVNVSVGTIFSILEQPVHKEKEESDILQPGYRQLAGGYVLYGPSTELVYTTGHGVHMFTLDPDIGTFILFDEGKVIPSSGKIYSINEGNFESFPKGIQKWLEYVKKKENGPYTSRYVGSLVADFHRTLLKGGIFVYPATTKHPNGKLRLLYEANPLSFITEQAKGKATNGEGRILDIKPDSLHQRTPLIIGSADEVDLVQKFLSDYK